MGIKDKILSLRNTHDFPILVTEELHQVFSIQGYKRKSLATLLNTFGCISYNIELTFPFGHDEEWKLQEAGRLKSHIQLAATIQVRLLPMKETPPDNYVHITAETATRLGKEIFKNKAAKLLEQQPDDAMGIFEFLGRLSSYYPQCRSWEWYLCPRAGTSLNLHLQPAGVINPKCFLRAQNECTIARINTINIYPYTIEIVFHAFSQIEHLPYNRRHRARFNPY